MKAKFYYTNGKTHTERDVIVSPESLENGDYVLYEKPLSDGRIDGFSQVKVYKYELAAVELIDENGRSVFTYKSAVSAKITVTGYGH